MSFPGQQIEHDHAFYTVTTTTQDEEKLSSLIRMKSRTRSDNLTCVAVNPAGQVSRSVSVQILGPGSPPSTVTLQSERGGYTVSWLPPSHPNGNITKYVVYHTFNKDDPLSDWQKLVLDGTENSVRVLSKTEDAFYVRVQAAADSGPGVISDIVAIEKDSEYLDTREPVEGCGESSLNIQILKINVRCVARGKPRPQLFYVLTEVGDDPEAESLRLLLSDDVRSKMKEYWREFERSAARRFDASDKVRAINEAGAGPLSEAIHFTTPNGGDLTEGSILSS
ncbi:fibronectin type III domain protein [Ostertagia ostertagi]